jgi:hypothetical protein
MRTAAVEPDWTIEITAGIEALVESADALMLVAGRAAEAARARGDEIDAVLAKLRDLKGAAA